jgi:hypothetical protein
MKEHLALMRTMGYRYDSQEVRFSAFDRFLQTRPDLTAQPLQAQLDAWTGVAHAHTRVGWRTTRRRVESRSKAP